MRCVGVVEPPLGRGTLLMSLMMSLAGQYCLMAFSGTATVFCLPENLIFSPRSCMTFYPAWPAACLMGGSEYNQEIVNLHRELLRLCCSVTAREEAKKTTPRIHNCTLLDQLSTLANTKHACKFKAHWASLRQPHSREGGEHWEASNPC